SAGAGRGRASCQGRRSAAGRATRARAWAPVRRDDGHHLSDRRTTRRRGDAPMNVERTAVFPGTFDPFTNGHLDLTRRAARLFDRVVVAVAHNPAKGTLFPVEERVEMIRHATRSMRRVEVVEFSDL